MANLTFSDLQNEVYMHLGITSTQTDPAGNAYSTDINRWLNYVQQDICARWPWPFMLGRETIVTVPDYVTGTVSINAGSTALTGTGTTFSSNINTQYYIQFSTANDWYQISTYNSGTSLNLSTAYQQTTNATNVTYIIRKIFYSLSSSADRIIDIRNWNTPIKLIQVDLRTIDTLNPLVQSTNAPYGYVMFGYDSSGNLQISPYPFPTDARLFEIRTTKRPVDMVNATDSPSIPNKYAHLIAWGAIAIGYAFKGKEFLELATAWNNKFEQRLAEMKKEYRSSEDYQPILGSIDSVARQRWIQFPEQFPVLNS